MTDSARDSTPNISAIEPGLLQSGPVSGLQQKPSRSSTPTLKSQLGSSVPESPSTQSVGESSVVIHDDEGDTTGGSLFEDVSIGGGLVDGELLRGLGASPFDRAQIKSASTHPDLGPSGMTRGASAESALTDEISFEMVEHSSFDGLGRSTSSAATSVAGSPNLSRRAGGPALQPAPAQPKPRSASGTSSVSTSARPSLSPIREPSPDDAAVGDAVAAAHLDPTASAFAPPAVAAVQAEVAGGNAVVDRFEVLVERTKGEWGDLNRAGRQALGEMGLKSIPSMHGPLSLPYARCPS